MCYLYFIIKISIIIGGGARPIDKYYCDILSCLVGASSVGIENEFSFFGNGEIVS